MKISKLIIAIAIPFTILSCAEKQEVKPTETPETKTTEVEETIEVSVINTDSIVATIDSKRETIELNLATPVELSTATLREKIKQKWEKIHFYTVDGKVVRIKTYSYASISKRTEEFYFDNEMLILAVIEDDGSAPKGKKIEEMSKAYYFQNNEMIRELKSETKVENTVKDSDAEELLSEANEYLTLFKEIKTK